MLGARGTYHWNDWHGNDRLDLYAGVFAGYNIGTYRNKSTRTVNGVTTSHEAGADYTDRLKLPQERRLRRSALPVHEQLRSLCRGWLWHRLAERRGDLQGALIGAIWTIEHNGRPILGGCCISYPAGSAPGVFIVLAYPPSRYIRSPFSGKYPFNPQPRGIHDPHHQHGQRGHRAARMAAGRC